MSYFVSFSIDAGGQEPVKLSDHNYTYNVWQMFYAVFPAGERGLYYLCGKVAGDCIETLETAIVNFRNQWGELSKYNPVNGWGNAEGALNFLESILRDCYKFPKCIIEVS